MIYYYNTGVRGSGGNIYIYLQIRTRAEEDPSRGSISYTEYYCYLYIIIIICTECTTTELSKTRPVECIYDVLRIMVQLSAAYIYIFNFAIVIISTGKYRYKELIATD